MSQAARVALVGGGVIGGGWAGRLVENGVDVVVHDPDPEAPRRLQEMLDNAERAWARLTLAPRRRGHVSFATSLDDAVRDADVVQESAPEDEGLKRRLLAEIAAKTRPDTLVCSSTSGLLPSRLQADMARADRFVVGHPFNPVYLLPLVEVVAGERTSAETVDRACDFYTSIGMKPLRVRHEIDGFVADRLLEALWREALWLVHDGIATTAEVDDAIRYGPGLRWAQMGSFLTYRIAGGEDGMRHFIAQFGPALQWPWTKLTDVPELTESFVDTIASQSDAQSEGLSVRELERIRDDVLIGLLHALRAEDYAAGAVLNEHERRLFDAAHLQSRELDESRPLQLYDAVVRPDWADYNGHMTESRYLEVLANATDGFLRHVGMDSAYLANGHSLYTVETHIRHLAEARAGELLSVTTQVLGADEKRVHLFHTIALNTSGEPVATGEHMLVHVDTAAQKASPIVEPVAGRVAAAAAAHASLQRPDGAGRQITETDQGDRPMTLAPETTLRSDLERGATLPASWYSDPDVLRLEHERIFRRSWQYAGVASDASTPGAFFTCRIGDVPVVVVRGRHGELRGFVNVCRHRGHEVVEGCGRRETLQCPYHAWTYDLDGSLRNAPRSEREDGFDREEWSLLPVQIETWGPLVFANPDPAAPPLGEILGELPAQLAAHGLDPSALEYRGRSRELVITANWKIVVENFLECYHCPVAHKSFSRLIDVDPDAYGLTTARWSSSQYAPVQTGRSGLPYDPVGEVTGSHFHYIWPNWTLNTLPGPPHVRVLVFRPLDAERTATFVDGFWAPGTPDEVIEEITAFGAVVGKEDVDLVESVHRGLRSGVIEHGRLLLDSEHLLQHFQLLVHDALVATN